MAAEIGRIISLTQIGDSALPLYIQTTKKKLETPEYDPKNKFSLRPSSSNYVVKSDFVDSIESAIEYCDFFMKVYFPHLYEEFNKSHFFIEVGCEGITRPLAIHGQSCGFALALTIISSIFGLRIRDGVAVTGRIDRKGNVLFVTSMKEKLDRFLKDNSLSMLLEPYVSSKSEDPVKVFYQYLDEHIDFMEQHGKIVFLCTSILEALYVVTPETSSLESIVSRVKYKDGENKFFSDMRRCWENLHDTIRYRGPKCSYQGPQRFFPGGDTLSEIWDKTLAEVDGKVDRYSELMRDKYFEFPHPEVMKVLNNKSTKSLSSSEKKLLLDHLTLIKSGSFQK